MSCVPGSHSPSSPSMHKRSSRVQRLFPYPCPLSNMQGSDVDREKSGYGTGTKRSTPFTKHSRMCLALKDDMFVLLHRWPTCCNIPVATIPWAVVKASLWRRKTLTNATVRNCSSSVPFTASAPSAAHWQMWRHIWPLNTAFHRFPWPLMGDSSIAPRTSTVATCGHLSLLGTMEDFFASSSSTCTVLRWADPRAVTS